MSLVVNRIAALIDNSRAEFTIKGFDGPLHVAKSRTKPTTEIELWYGVHDSDMEYDVVVDVIGTGVELPDLPDAGTNRWHQWARRYVGTTQSHDGRYVWHTWLAWRIAPK